MTEKKSDRVKNILVHLGILLVLVGSTAVKGDNLTFFFMGLVLLAFQVFEMPAIKPKKLVIAEIMVSATLAVGAITQLVMSSGFKAQQAFQIVLLLGSLLILVEAVRKYADI